MWDLNARPDELRALATSWKSLHDDVDSERSTFTAKVSATMPHWDAENGADFQASYAGAQADAMTDLAGGCMTVHGALTTLAGGLDDVQGRLDASFGRLTSAMPHENIGILGIDPFVVFHPDDDKDEALIETETHTAKGLVEESKQLVSQCNATLSTVPETFSRLASSWRGEADGSDHRWSKHPTGASSYRTVQTIDGFTIVSGTSADEHVRVEIDPKTGETVLIFSRITVEDRDPDPKKSDNHWVYTEDQRIRVPAGQEVVLNTGEGDDQLEVPEGVNVRLRVTMGGGDDQVRGSKADDRLEVFGGAGDDRITTGHGADFISGGADDDYQDGGSSADQVFGRGGDDSAYGLDGNDLISGGDGIDFSDGGSDDDTIFGGRGDDVVGGGRDDDAMYGGEGDDTLFGGHGDDFADGGVTTGSDGTVTGDDDQITIGSEDSSQQDAESDTVITLEYDGSQGGFIEVEGSPEFQARVNSDLEFLRSTSDGQQMLRKLTELRDDQDSPWNPFDGKNSYKIREFDPTASDDNGFESGGNDGSDVTITYRPEWTTMDGDDTSPYDATPPLVILYHEMGHSYQFMSGTVTEGRTLQPGGGSVNSLERQNVGLSYSENDRSGDDVGLPPDHDEDPDQHQYRENGLRDELGIDRRTQY